MADSNKFGYWADSSEQLLKSQFPLHHACREGNVERLSLLLTEAQHGIYVEDGFYGWTPAHWAAYFGKLKCLMCLLEHGVNCDVTTLRFNQTPAHIAAFSAHSHCLKWLLHCGATINRQDYLGETPVHKAARTGSMECVSLLAAHGANLRMPNNSRHTPAQLGRMCGYNECGQYLESIVQGQEMNKTTLVPTPQESPAPHKVESCVVTQGLNAGRIPTDNVENGDHHDMEMEDEETLVAAGDGAHLNGNVNGHIHTNGFANHAHSPAVNGFSAHAPPMTGTCDGDITVVPAISQNRVPIAGKKRAREEFEDHYIKRPRQGGPDELPVMDVTPMVEATPVVEEPVQFPISWDCYGFNPTPVEKPREKRVMVNGNGAFDIPRCVGLSGHYI